MCRRRTLPKIWHFVLSSPDISSVLFNLLLIVFWFGLKTHFRKRWYVALTYTTVVRQSLSRDQSMSQRTYRPPLPQEMVCILLTTPTPSGNHRHVTSLCVTTVLKRSLHQWHRDQLNSYPLFYICLSVRTLHVSKANFAENLALCFV